MGESDLIFYLLDLAIFIMLLNWLRNTRKIEVHTGVGARWVIPALFIVVAVIGFFRYKDDIPFRYIETVCLVVFAVMYYNIGSGLCEEGIVNMGALVPWDSAGKVRVMDHESCIIYKWKRREASMYFDADKMDEVRKYLRTHGVKHKVEK